MKGELTRASSADRAGGKHFQEKRTQTQRPQSGRTRGMFKKSIGKTSNVHAAKWPSKEVLCLWRKIHWNHFTYNKYKVLNLGDWNKLSVNKQSVKLKRNSLQGAERWDLVKIWTASWERSSRRARGTHMAVVCVERTGKSAGAVKGPGGNTQRVSTAPANACF